MRPFCQETSLVEEQNAIGQLHRFWPMGNQERRASYHKSFQRHPHLLERFPVQMGGGLIQKENARFAEKKPCQGN
jgi:hypothetical protein